MLTIVTVFIIMATTVNHQNKTHSTVISQQQRLTGTVDIVTFHNPLNGFCVLKVKTKESRELMTVVGNCPQVHTGELVECEGEWTNDRKHGLQFKALSLSVFPPSNIEGMQKYLASGMIKGIGKHFAKQLIEAFGEKVFDVIENQSERLQQLPGIGQKRVESIINAWEQQKAIRDIMVFLQSHGMGCARAVRIYKIYGNQAVQLIQENPYRLANDIYGIGFKTADNLAQHLGIAPNALIRAQAGVVYSLQKWCEQGHCAATYESLVSESVLLLNTETTIIEQAIKKELQQQRLVGEVFEKTQFIYLSALYQAETGVCHHLQELNKLPSLWGEINIENAFPWVEQNNKIKLAPSQQQAIATALNNKISIITGGPGVGKTTVVRSLITILKAKKIKITLCAPTGRAAKRLSEASGFEAKTIHRLLEYEPATRTFKYNQEHPLRTDYLIVDEASMIDVLLMYHLLKAIPKSAGLLLVGDTDQLPAVGPGNILADLIQSGKIAVARMTEIFRQATTSHIVLNAHRINQGEMPLCNQASQDFFSIYHEDPEEIARELVDLVSQRLPKHYRCNPINTIQVLAPMNRGALGTRSLNIELQKILNPNATNHLNSNGDNTKSISRFGWTFAANDKVMQNVNNYEKNVFNGDIGTITEINQSTSTLKILFEHHSVEYDFNELDEISLAYAISIHKSQGSEYPIVVIPITTQHYPLLARNLLYTAVTRGKRLVVLLGQKKAIAMAINNFKSKDRITQLKNRLNNSKSN